MVTAVRGLLDNLPLAACAHRTGVVVHANPAFLLAHGGALDAVVGRPIGDVLGIGGGFRSFVVAFDGEEATIELATDGRLTERLEFSDRLASLGTLAAGVAHEINNPLTYVLANLDYIREQLARLGKKTKSAELRELEEIAAEAKTGAERVAKIVRSLKVFSRLDEEKRVPVDVVRVLEVSIKMASNEIRHRARLVKDLDPTPSVVADEARLTQVFLNLLVNAAQAIPEGRADANEIRVTTRTDAERRAIIEIRDTGVGITPENMRKVFDPFFTTKPQEMGTGLGLSICHGIVSALGGDIGVESNASGTTFRVVLPGVDTVPSSHPPATRISSAKGKSGRVLVVDDDAAIGQAIRRTLAHKHEIVTVTNGREALELLHAGERFDLILCDVMMPVMTGMELHEEVVRISPELAERIVFLTGGAFTASARAFLDRVPNERLDKPFDGARLRLLARAMVDTGG